MERVHYQQEQMLPELKDLTQKNLFTEKEIRHIVKQRTVFETAMVRRVAKKADFVRYISYEMDLETLRKKRAKRMDLPKAPATVSDYAFVRRQFHIFERALKRFKSDVGLWVQYIQVAKRGGARALVGRVTARALQLHPNIPTFYILAAAHELNNLAPSAARVLLQRGIRANPGSVDMWKEYVKMELGFIESLRRRWSVLGIQPDTNASRKRRAKAADNDPCEEEDRAYEKTEADEETVDGAEAREQIMDGAIVQSVIVDAAKALPKIDLFVALEAVISEHPSPPALQSMLLDMVYDVLKTTLPRDPRGMEMRAARHLKSDSTTPGFVDGVSAANEEMLGVIGDGGEEALLESYAAFVETLYGKMEDGHLKMYLIASLQGLIEKSPRSPSLHAAHLRLLIRAATAPAKLCQLAQKYCSKTPHSAGVWLARLAVEGSAEVWAEARKNVRGSEEEVQSVWTWGLENGEPPEAKKRMHEDLLRESLGQPSLHEALLVRYARGHPEPGSKSDQWLLAVRHIARSYPASAAVWRTLFARAAAGAWEGQRRVLEIVHEQWRAEDGAAAMLEWAQWLMAHGDGAAAAAAVSRTQSGRTEGWPGLLE